MGSDTSLQLNSCLIEASGNTSCLKDLLTQASVTDSQSELLFLGGLGGWEMCGQEIFKGWGNLIVSNHLDVFQSFLSSLKWLVGSDGDHLGEALERIDSLLNLGETSTCLVVLLLFKEAIAIGGLIKNKHLHLSSYLFFYLINNNFN